MPPRITPPSLDTLLATFDAAPDSTARTLAAMALVRTRLRDDRILAALGRLLDENPVGAAACLARHGDARAIPDLVRAFDCRLPESKAGEQALALLAGERPVSPA